VNDVADGLLTIIYLDNACLGSVLYDSKFKACSREGKQSDWRCVREGDAGIAADGELDLWRLPGADLVYGESSTKAEYPARDSLLDIDELGALRPSDKGVEAALEAYKSARFDEFS